MPSNAMNAPSMRGRSTHREVGVESPHTIDPKDEFAASVRHYRSGNLEQAEFVCRHILTREPRQADALDLLGIISHQRGNSGAALRSLGLAITADPGNPRHHSNKGVVCRDRGEVAEAAACFQEALRLDPNFVEAHNNLGTVLQGQGRLEEALAHYREALRLQPDLAAGHRNLGTVLQGQGRLEEALAHYREALRLHPDYAEAHNNLGTILQGSGRLREALVHYREALRLHPDYAEANVNHAQASLLLGDFEHGWQGYEWRWRLRQRGPCRFREPRWDGSPLRGRTILLHAEQGCGDTVQFIRYTALVKERVGAVIVQCQSALIRLVTTCPGIDAVIPAEAVPPRFDVHAPLLSLPGIFHTSLASIPAEVPYLQPPRGKDGFLDAALGVKRDGLRVGIVWAGSPTHRNDRDRSCALSWFRGIACRPDVALFSLQKGPRAADLGEQAGGMEVTDLSDHLCDFADTAAAIDRLDLVITVDTAVAHLAGALGKPVWVLLPFAPDWRWLLDREDSPWYPSMRLFRQSRPGDWPGVFARLSTALGAAGPAILRSAAQGVLA
jgi:Flp pilus assembly protein TadD